MPINHPSFGKLEDGRIIIFDTTLRDGEQSPGFSMNLNEKIRMAEALTELGVDVLEAGFAIASPGDFESVKTIAETIGQRADSPVLASLSRAGAQDVMASAEALKSAKRSRIHIVIATSDLHMKYKLRLEPDEVIAATVASVKLARDHADDVEWSAEDATRSDIDFLARCCEAAIKAGATTINLPDTVGYAMPEDMERMYAQIRAKVPNIDTVVLSTHNHNDLGMGVANTLAAIRGRRAANRIHDQRHRRARRQRVAGRNRHGDPHASRCHAVQEQHPDHAIAAAVEAARHGHRIRRAAEQGDRRPQRFRA